MPSSTSHILRARADIQFVSAREEQEFYAVSPRLRALLWEVADFSKRSFDITPVITHLVRTQAEQEAIYGVGVKKRSPHQDARAADLRSRIYAPGQVKDLVTYVNAEFPRGDGFPTALYHTVGRGWHLDRKSVV